MGIYIHKTKIGKIEINTTNKGLCKLHFTDEKESRATVLNPITAKIVKQITDFFALKRKNFELPLDLKGTPFQRQVWKTVYDIPFGTTISYLKIAQKLGDVKKVRAVANAIGKNPVLIIIPCHRVVGSDGKLVGYSGGIERKKELLLHEGYQFQNSLFS